MFTGYRKGVKTDLGDLEEKDWIQLATGFDSKKRRATAAEKSVGMGAGA